MTLRAIAGLLGEGAGSVWFGGDDVASVPTESRHVGYVPQGGALLPGRTVREQLAFGVGADASVASWWLRLLRLDGLEGRMPEQLSGGQRQRVALASALSRQPRVVLLDEPFSALDAPVREELRQELRRLQRETGLSTVLVTHDPEEAALLADEIVVIADGRLLQAGSRSEVYRRPVSPEVARLLGIENLVRGVAASETSVSSAGLTLQTAEHGVASGLPVLWSVRPEKVRVGVEKVRVGAEKVRVGAGEVRVGAAGEFAARVVDVADLGASCTLTLAVGDGPTPVELRSRTTDPVVVDVGDVVASHSTPTTCRSGRHRASPWRERLVVVKSERIIVVGSANQDYLLRVPSAPGPGETTIATGLTKQPGGKGANQAVAAARLGGDVHFVGAVGRDDDGATILRNLSTDGVSIDDVRIIDQQPTGLALIWVEDGGENSITVVSGANATVTAERASSTVTRLAGEGSIVVVQGELSRDVIETTVRAASEAGARIILNLAPFLEVDAAALALADPLVLNETEAGQLLGAPVPDASAVLAARDRLLAIAPSVVVTLGGEGAVWSARGDDGPAGGHVPAEKVATVVDTTGAGDAFVGALAYALAGSAALADAVRLGARAGSFAIGGVGAQKSYARASDLGLAAGAAS